MAADKAAIPFKKREADTAVLTGNCSRIKSGANIRPPPRPTMVRIKEAAKMTGNRMK